MADNQFSFKKEVTDDSEVTLQVSIVKEEFKKQKDHVYHDLAKDVVITGFRPGKAPKPLIEARLGPELFEKTLNKLLPDITYQILEQEKLEPITQVRYEVKKVSEDEGVEYTAKFVVYPKIKLANFSKISVKSESIEVSEDEIKKEQQRILDSYHDKKAADSDKAKEQPKAVLDDAFVASLGLGVNTVSELNEEIKKQIESNKKYAAEEKRINEIIKQAISMSKIVPPHALVHEELHHREADYKQRIEKLGLNLDDFLKTQKTSMDELMKTWEQDATDKVATELLMYQIIKEQDLKISAEEVQAELDKITDPKLKEEYDTNYGKRYIGTVLLQQKALNWLRSQVK